MNIILIIFIVILLFIIIDTIRRSFRDKNEKKKEYPHMFVPEAGDLYTQT